MKYIYLCLFSFPALAAISPTLVQERALKFHPTVLSALENVRASEHTVTGAHGAFDAKIVSDYKRQMKHSPYGTNPGYNTTLSRTQLEKRIRVANAKVYIGSEQVSNPNGFFSPIYHTGNPTSQAGNYNLIGARISLWKDFLIDPDRAALKNAKLDRSIAKSEKKLTELDISRMGQLAYWEWVTATKVKNAYAELLKNGETRNDYLMARHKKGDIAQIIVTENEQYMASRKGSLQAAIERLVRAEYDLSLFYRDNDGNPIVPAQDESYEDYPSKLSALLDQLDLKTDVEEIIQKRPDMKNLALRVDKSEVDLELAKQDLNPRIDVSTEYFERTIDHRGQNGKVPMPYDYLMVLATVNIPIERNLGNGNMQAARARKMITEKQLAYGKQTYTFEVMALRKALYLQLEQVVQSEIEYTKAKELVVSETYKFKTGGGNLFLVNIREQAQTSAEASFHESRLAFMNTLLHYQALTSTVE